MIDHPEREPRPRRQAVALDVEAQRVGAIRQGGARVGEELGRVRRVAAPRSFIEGDGGGERGPPVGRHRVHALLAAHAGAIPVPHEYRHVIDAGPQCEELLKDDALVGPQRLLKAAHAYHLVAGHLTRRRGPTSGVGAEAHLDVVLGGS